MLDFIRSWVFNIVTLTIFIVLIEILIPSGKTKKFVSLVSGFLLLIAILNPLLGLINKGVDLKEIELENSNYIDKRDIENSSKVFQDSQMKQIANTYKKKIIKQLEDSTREIKGISNVKADVVINEDYKSDKFGEIKKAYLYISMGDETISVKTVAKVEKVRIDGRDMIQESTDENSREVDGEIRKQLENKLNKLFDLGKENIIISLQENK
jgi:stage III sporulation protein AF